MRKSIVLIVSLALILAFSLLVNGQNKELQIELDNEPIDFDVKPIIENGRTLAQANTLFEKMGIAVTWDEKSQTITIDEKYKSIELVIGKQQAKIYHKYDLTGIPEELTLDVAPRVVDGKPLIPVRFVAEALKAKVEWVSKEWKVVIVTENTTNEPVRQIPISFTEISPKDVDNIPVLKDFVNEKRQAKGIHSIEVDGKYYVLVAAGEQRTGGYSINIEGVYSREGGKAFVDAVLVSPNPNDMVIQVITYPTMLIVIDESSEITSVTGEIR